MTKRAAIVLAGGKGQRFQTANGRWQDKALANLEGKPLLVHVINNVQKVVDDILVIVNDETRKYEYGKILASFNVEGAKILTDLKIKNLSGPMIAILTGLSYTQADYCLTIPADMPMLNRKVAEYFFDKINGSYVAVPMWPNGRIETLLMVLQRSTTVEIATLLCQLGRSHPDDIIRGASRALFVSPLGKIKDLDPNLCSFVNINSQEDLSLLKPRQGEGLGEDVRLNLGNISTGEIAQLKVASSKLDNAQFFEAATHFQATARSLEEEALFFWAAISREFEAKSALSLSEQSGKPILVEDSKTAFLKAAENYTLESDVYRKKKCYLLAERAIADKNWCEQRALSLK